jgi:hypothetical protein
LRHVQYDYRRYWELTTVWFDGQPVMIVQNAGREGDDYHERFITDPHAYADMVGYLRTLLPADLNDPSDVVDPNVERDDLLAFYSDEFCAPVDSSPESGESAAGN